MGLHVGQIERRSHGHVGIEIHRAARVGAAAHGGQLLMTGVAAELLREVVPSQPLGAHRLKDFPAPTPLYCAVIDGRGASAFAPPRTLELRAGSVPALSTSLIGREHDLERVQTALRQESERLVTLLGRGGVGKTSVALASAHDLLGDYAGGVWWVDAHHERDRDGLAMAIARTCRVDADGSTEEGLVAELKTRGPLLLVLDNLEAIAGAGELVDRLLVSLSELNVLATSQLPLRCPQERRLRLDRLATEDGVALLARTARRLDVSPDDDPAAVELVELLDGLPLALELAAGRLQLFNARELVTRLRTSTALLQDRARPERHRSLTAALEWTLDLLDLDARELFMRLGVFAGPVELEDIEVAVGDELDVISAATTLVDAALLRRVESGDGQVRFGFPEAIREQARRSLDAAGGERWRRAHAIWQRDLVWPLRIYEWVDEELVRRGHAAANQTRAALAWAWDQDRELGRELAVGRYPLAARAGARQEARELLDLLVADPAVADLMRVHTRSSYGAPDDAELLEGEGSMIALLPQLTDLQARRLCMANIGINLTWEHRFEEAVEWLDRAAELARDDDPLARASILAVKADALMDAGDFDRAERTIRESDALAGPRRSSDRNMLRATRAELASRRGRHAEALDDLGRLLGESEATGDVPATMTAIVYLVRAFARTDRDRELLETVGIIEAWARDSPSLRRHGEAAMAEPRPVIDASRARLGAEAAIMLDAGRAVEPSQRVKRVLALLNTDPA
jgi:predicted ATPase